MVQSGINYKKMKIGILTLPLHTNYGGILQAYALQTVLERMGHEVVVIDKEQHKKEPSMLSYVKRYIKKYIFQKNVLIFAEKTYNESYAYVSRNTQRFIDNNIHHIYIKPEEIKEGEYEAFIVGSDQIWRPSYYKPIQNAFLLFTKGWNVKRLAYAASFGSDVWEYSKREEKECRELINKFDAVSVREKNGVELCKEHFGIQAFHVADPTMLLMPHDYVKIGNIIKNSERQIVTYILDESPLISDITRHLSQKMDLPTHRANSRFEDYSAPIEERVQPPVESWLTDLYNAELIITDSFHACVFSILFNKEFIVIGNKSRGNMRVQSLLASLNIADRYCCDIESCDIALNSKTDYEKVNALLNRFREESINFLSNNL